MSLTSDRFCVYLRKDTDNTELLRFINGQKSLSASIRLLIKAYMATAKTLDVESADLFDVIDSVSAKSLASLDRNMVADERMSRQIPVKAVVDNSMGETDDAFDDIVDESVDNGVESQEVLPETKVEVKEEPAKIEPVASKPEVADTSSNSGDSSGSIDDFMGEF